MDSFMDIADWIGTIAFAVSGIILSIRKNLDLMGTYIVSILTSSGGGLIRDVLLNQSPTLLSSRNTFIAVLILTLLFKLLKKGEYIDNLEGTFLFRISDTSGLVAFAIIGSQKAIDHGLDFFPALTMALLSSVGGGLIRDALLGQINSTLTSGFYGSVSIIVGIMIYYANLFQLPSQYYLPAIFVIGMLIRTIAVRFNFNLAKIK